MPSTQTFNRSEGGGQRGSVQPQGRCGGVAIGVIGAGAVVENSHLPVLMSIPGMTVAWVSDRNAERAGLLSKMYGVRAIDAPDVDAALEAIDVCLLAVPYGARDQYIGMCAQRRKALYVEKPFAKDLPEHDRYCGMFPAHRLAVGFQRRYYRGVSVLSSIVAAAAFGALRSVSFTQGHFQLKGGSGYLSDAALSGGGVVMESAIHSLDQILILTGATDVRVGEVRAMVRGGIDYDTIFHSELTTGAGPIPVRCEVSMIRNLGSMLELDFERARVRWNLSPNGELIIEDPKRRGRQLALDIADQEGRLAMSVGAAFDLFWKDFVIAVETGVHNTTLGFTSRLTTGWIQRIYAQMERR
jgi:predicted dehydrogenase